MGIVRAITAFAYTDKSGVPRTVTAGQLFDATDPCVVKRPKLFTSVEGAVTGGGSSETTSAAPGELRTRKRGRPPKRIAEPEIAPGATGPVESLTAAEGDD